ncbi:L,D-transpeptidase family protein [Litoribacillus peritrichatus]
MAEHRFYKLPTKAAAIHLWLLIATVAAITTLPVMAEEHAMQSQTPLKKQILNQLENTELSATLKQKSQVLQLYQRFGFQLVWFKRSKLTPAGQALIQAIKETAVVRAPQLPYHAYDILYQRHTLRTQPDAIIALDILLSDGFLSYAKDVLTGKILPNQNEPDHPVIWRTSATESADRRSNRQTREQLLSILDSKLSPQELETLISQDLTPAHPGYLGLRRALEHYLQLAQTGTWYPLTPGAELKMGDSHPQVSEVKARLSQLGDYDIYKRPVSDSSALMIQQSNQALRDFNAPLNHPANAPTEFSEYFDLTLSTALKHFQRRHNLEANGKLNDATRAQLNVPPQSRIRQIAMNMKRWRYLPANLGQRYIMANMADYRLRVIDHGKTTLDMDIIVGRQSRRTPILVQTLKTLVLNPSWNIPPRIARTTYLPKAIKSPAYLQKQNIEIVQGFGRKRTIIDPFELDWENIDIKKFPYRLEQKPGARNSLGQVKFPLNNDFAIFLHDTSKPHLFNKPVKALSSGCVRLEKPHQLTEELLKYNPGWDKRRISKVHRRKKTMYIGLKRETPVYLMYWTAWVDEQGTLQFRDDIYQRDLLSPNPASISM